MRKKLFCFGRMLFIFFLHAEIESQIDLEVGKHVEHFERILLVVESMQGG